MMLLIGAAATRGGVDRDGASLTQILSRATSLLHRFARQIQEQQTVLSVRLPLGKVSQLADPGSDIGGEAAQVAGDQVSSLPPHPHFASLVEAIDPLGILGVSSTLR